MEFITYTQALELKELGFDELCWAWYNIPDEDVRYCYSEQRSPITNSHEEWSAQIWGKKAENIGLPTSSQVLKWFREKYGLIGIPQYFTGGYYCFTINDMKDTKESNRLFTEYLTYEEAEDACITKLIEVVKQK